MHPIHQPSAISISHQPSAISHHPSSIIHDSTDPPHHPQSLTRRTLRGKHPEPYTWATPGPHLGHTLINRNKSITGNGGETRSGIALAVGNLIRIPDRLARSRPRITALESNSTARVHPHPPCHYLTLAPPELLSCLPLTRPKKPKTILTDLIRASRCARTISNHWLPKVNPSQAPAAQQQPGQPQAAWKEARTPHAQRFPASRILKVCIGRFGESNINFIVHCAISKPSEHQSSKLPKGSSSKIPWILPSGNPRPYANLDLHRLSKD